MTTKWIREPGPVHVPILQRHYSYVKDPYGGFMFDVDEKTQAVIVKNDASRESYEKALAGVRAGTMVDHGVMDYGREHWDAGAIECGCGRTVELTRDWRGTRCECGREYGDNGQEFRANWREICRETGELQDDDFLS